MFFVQKEKVSLKLLNFTQYRQIKRQSKVSGKI